MMNDPHFHIAEVCQAENYKKKTKTMVNLLTRDLRCCIAWGPGT